MSFLVQLLFSAGGRSLVLKALDWTAEVKLMSGDTPYVACHCEDCSTLGMSP